MAETVILKLISLKFTLKIILISIYLSGCIGAGTHGSIASYDFSIKKDSLQKIVNQVIQEENYIARDSAIRYSYIDLTDGKNDTVWDHYYRDIVRYETIFIQYNSEKFQFIFYYTGTEESWDSLPNSSISIAYIHWNGFGGSESNLNSSLKKRGLEAFESSFISSIKERIN